MFLVSLALLILSGTVYHKNFSTFRNYVVIVVTILSILNSLWTTFQTIPFPGSSKFSCNPRAPCTPPHASTSSGNWFSHCCSSYFRLPHSQQPRRLHLFVECKLDNFVLRKLFSFSSEMCKFGKFEMKLHPIITCSLAFFFVRFFVEFPVQVFGCVGVIFLWRCRAASSTSFLFVVTSFLNLGPSDVSSFRLSNSAKHRLLNCIIHFTRFFMKRESNAIWK